jgi:purine-nucleoside phosphorylase
MEAAGLYGVAAENGARALTIATVSDHVRTGESTTPEERQQTFNEMVEIALDAIGRDIAQ